MRKNTMKNTIAFLLAGGEGKRLGALTGSRPKPLMPFAGKYRLIDFPLSNAANSRVRRLGILVQASQKSIMDYVENGESWGFHNPDAELKILPSRSDLRNNGRYRGTADAVRQNLDLIKNDASCDTVLILSADHVYKMDYQKMINFHRANRADVTLAITGVARQETRKLGIVHQDSNNRIVKWEEKPSHSQSTLASMGVYVFSKKFLVHALETCQGNDFGHHIIPFSCQTAKMFSYRFSGYWRDVGTPDAYWQSNMDLLAPRNKINPVKWRIKRNRLYSTARKNIKHKYIASCARVENSIISKKCILMGQVVNSIILPGVRIAKNTYIRNSIIMNNCIIESGSQIENTILCDDVFIGKNAIIGCAQDSFSNFVLAGSKENGLVVIGENISIKPGECVHKNSMLFSQLQYFEESHSSRLRERSLFGTELLDELILN
jgi:glucose-1-phosphate adenylyltransferase